jgi:hypothetical protein
MPDPDPNLPDPKTPDADPAPKDPPKDPPADPPVDSTPPADPPKDPPSDPEPKPVDPKSEPPIDDPKDPVDARVVPAVDEYELADGMPKHLAQFASDNDMTQTQLDNTIEQFRTYITAGEKGKQTMLLNEGKAHVRTWGKQAKGNMSVVRRALKQNDPDGTLKKVLDSSGYGNHPAILDFLLSIGTSMQEGGFLKSDVNIPPGKKSAAQVIFGDNHPSKN